MNPHRYLIADADLEIMHESGTRISLHITSGKGEIELSDGKLLRMFAKHALLKRRRWLIPEQVLEPIRQVRSLVDISVAGRRIARLDTQRESDFLCRMLGLPYCSIRPFALVIALFA